MLARCGKLTSCFLAVVCLKMLLASNTKFPSASGRKSCCGTRPCTDDFGIHGGSNSCAVKSTKMKRLLMFLCFSVFSFFNRISNVQTLGSGMNMFFKPNSPASSMSSFLLLISAVDAAADAAVANAEADAPAPTKLSIGLSASSLGLTCEEEAWPASTA